MRLIHPAPTDPEGEICKPMKALEEKLRWGDVSTRHFAKGARRSLLNREISHEKTEGGFLKIF